jgi:hypothetical protein
MWDGISEACDAVQAAAAGKDETEIRRMLTAELRSRDVSLPPEIFDSLVKKIAAGTRAPGEPLVSVKYGGLLRVPFIRNAVRQMFQSALTASGDAGIMKPSVSWVSQDIGDSWWFMSQTLPHPPGRDLYAPAPDEVPPSARLIPDPDLRERIPELFKPLPPPPAPPGWSDAPPVDSADQVFVWLEDSGGTVAVCNQPGRIGILNAEDAEAYLPLVRAADVRDKVVAATADIGRAAVGLSHSTVRIVADRSDRTASGDSAAR